jgi:hypothetical protein
MRRGKFHFGRLQSGARGAKVLSMNNPRAAIKRR